MRKKILILTNLFFNKHGNQSFLETVKCYETYFDVFIITSASKINSYYYHSEEVRDYLPHTKVYYIYQIIPNILRAIVKMMPKKKRVRVTISTDFQNLEYGKINILSHHLASIFLYHKAKKIIKTMSFDFVCAYEVGAVSSVVKMKRKNLLPKAGYFAKYQGTVLGFSYKESNNTKYYNKYKIDIDAYRLSKLFDMCAITNDGTNGRKVLEYFGVDRNKIAYFPNGISSKLKTSSSLTKIDTSCIRLFTLSRLIGWKRVYLSVLIMDKLVNLYGCKNFMLNIYGFGNDDEISFITKIIEEKQILPYVKLNGPIAFDKIQDVYNNNDILMSLYKNTNVTNPLLEAMYVNKYIISIKDDNLVDIVSSIGYSNIFLFNEVSEEQLISDIAEFILNFNFNNKRIIKDFDLSWNERIHKELSILESCISAPI